MKDTIIIKHRSKRKYYSVPPKQLSNLEHLNLFATESENIHTFKSMTEEEKQYYARELLVERESKEKCDAGMIADLLGIDYVPTKEEPEQDISEFIKSLLGE
jgi:hypothetical protein